MSQELYCTYPHRWARSATDWHIDLGWRQCVGYVRCVKSLNWSELHCWGRRGAVGHIDWTLPRCSCTRRHVATRRPLRPWECVAVAHISRGGRRGVEASSASGFFGENFLCRPFGTHKIFYQRTNHYATSSRSFIGL